MASIINEKKNTAVQQPAVTPAATPAAAATNTAPSVAGTTQQSTLKGVSESTSAKLNQYSQGYTPSANVQAAQDYLNGVLNKKPVSDQQLSDLYDSVMNREKFSYDLNGDMLYQQYKDQYQNMGQQAMMDTMGNAAAMTGGYGNSYAQTAGQQAYQNYLQQLNNMVPELYRMALNQYNVEGDELQNRYNMAYGKYRDELGDWQNERSYANSDYWAQRDADYNEYQTMLNYWNQLAQQENAAYYTERDYAYAQAKAILAKGNMPSSALLKAAGISSADAKKMKAKKSSGGSSRSSSGGSGSSSGGSGSSSSSNSSSTTSSVASKINQLVEFYKQSHGFK